MTSAHTRARLRWRALPQQERAKVYKALKMLMARGMVKGTTSDCDTLARALDLLAYEGDEGVIVPLEKRP